MNSILNKTVSAFTNCHNTSSPIDVNLLSWLTSPEYVEQVTGMSGLAELCRRIANTQDKELRDLMKKTLPAITISARCKSRTEIIEHSGLLCFDIDFKDNQHLSNFFELRDELKKIVTVAYVGKSVSGKGWFVIMPIAYPEKHKAHFEHIKHWLKKYNILIDDKPKNPVSLRFYSNDPEAYFNHDAEVLTAYHEEKSIKQSKPVYHNDDTETVENIIREIEKSCTDITSGYGVWFAIACDLAGTFGINGEGYFQTISQYHPEYSQGATERQYKAALKFMMGKGAGLGALVNTAKDYSIRIPRREPKPIEPINILINQIIAAPCETITTFDGMRLLYVKTENGKTYDLLFDKDGNPVSELTPQVKELETFFEKKFCVGKLDGQPALINCN